MPTPNLTVNKIDHPSYPAPKVSIGHTSMAGQIVRNVVMGQHEGNRNIEVPGLFFPGRSYDGGGRDGRNCKAKT